MPNAKPPKRKKPETRVSSAMRAQAFIETHQRTLEKAHQKPKKQPSSKKVSASFQKQMDALISGQGLAAHSGKHYRSGVLPNQPKPKEIPPQKVVRAREPLPKRDADYIQQEIRVGIRYPDGRKITVLREVMIPIQTDTGRVAYFNVRAIEEEADIVQDKANALRIGRKTDQLTELRLHVDALRSLLMGWGRPESMPPAGEKKSSR